MFQKYFVGDLFMCHNSKAAAEQKFQTKYVVLLLIFKKCGDAQVKTVSFHVSLGNGENESCACLVNVM